ncbi:MAG: quercetin 2,3-dioxygenase [Pseudonocardiaceae bacterium]
MSGAEMIWFLQNLVVPLVRGDETDGRFTLMQMDGPPGDQPPLHVHRDTDEGLFVLSGQLTVWAGKQQVSLGPGEFFHAARGVPHTYRVSDAGPARWLVTASPAGFDTFVALVGKPASEHRLPDAGPPPDPEQLASLAAEHGIEILGPPGALPS